MDWSRSYTAEWRVFRVNPETWQDGEPIGKVDAIGIERTSDGPLLESGSMDCSQPIEDGWYRIAMTAVQDGEVERADVATLLFESSGGSVDGSTYSADGRSVLYPASTTAMLAGSFAHSGANGAEYAARLLRSAIVAPVEVEGSFTLNGDVVHDFGSSVLDAAWAVLDAGGFCMQVDGDGTVRIRKMPSTPSLLLDSEGMRLLMPRVSFSDDRSGIPNRFTAVDGTRSATAVNDDPASPVSTVSRGYAVDAVDDKAVLVNGETVEAHARRRLVELSTLSDVRDYTREYVPGVLPFDIIRVSIPAANLDGDMRVQSQSLACGAGITVTERAIMEVPLWQG